MSGKFVVAVDVGFSFLNSHGGKITADYTLIYVVLAFPVLFHCLKYKGSNSHRVEVCIY